METQERRREPGFGPTGGGPADGNGLEALRREAEAHLAAGDAAINRVLSRNSEAFNTANRQSGGE